MSRPRSLHSVRYLRGLVVLAAVTAVAGCTAGSPAPVPSGPSSEPVPTTISSPTPTAAAVAPLTGLPATQDSATMPSVASKIDNHPLARPQIGLEDTDLVFEELVEGGITRYVAVWQSNIPEQYGPVRSIRGMDPDILSPLKGLVTYSGGQSVFVAGMKNTPVRNVVFDYVGTGTGVFTRTSTKIAPHNVIAHTDELLKQFGKGLDVPIAEFEHSDSAATSTAAVSGKATARIDDIFSTSFRQHWAWDATNDVWLRSQGTAKDLDDQGKQLQAHNVVTLRVTTRTVSHTPKTIITGTGEAWVSSGGKTVHGTWKKSSKTTKLQLLDASGDPIKLEPGNTWFELVPATGSVAFH